MRFIGVHIGSKRHGKDQRRDQREHGSAPSEAIVYLPYYKASYKTTGVVGGEIGATRGRLFCCGDAANLTGSECLGKESPDGDQRETDEHHCHTGGQQSEEPEDRDR